MRRQPPRERRSEGATPSGPSDSQFCDHFWACNAQVGPSLSFSRFRWLSFVVQRFSLGWGGGGLKDQRLFFVWCCSLFGVGPPCPLSSALSCDFDWGGDIVRTVFLKTCGGVLCTRATPYLGPVEPGVWAYPGPGYTRVGCAQNSGTPGHGCIPSEFEVGVGDRLATLKFFLL